MRTFAISCLSAILGIIIGSFTINWAAISFKSINADIFILLSILPPCLGIAVGCIFFSQENWGKLFSSRNIFYSLLGALFSTLGWYIGFIMVIRGLYIKQFGGIEISFLYHFLNPSSLPSIVEKGARGIKEIRPNLAYCSIAFFTGLIGTWFLIFQLWISFGIKRQLAKNKCEALCLICGSLGFVRNYEHRIFYTIGTASYSKSYLFPLPFCSNCWASITSKRYEILNIKSIAPSSNDWRNICSSLLL